MNVVSYNGGKVHTMMPGMEEHPYPLCRGGGQNQNLTKFRTVDAPLTCKTCLGYADRREAAASATIADEASTTQGEIMAETTTTLDVNTEEGRAALDQIQANIERAASLAEAHNGEALEELGKETEAVISSLSGKGSIKAKKEWREAWTAAAVLPEAPKAVAKRVEAAPVKGWEEYAGTVELANMSVERIAEGVKAHAKVSTLAKDVAASSMEIWLRIPNSAGVPDLMGASQESKKASRAVYEKALHGVEDTYDNREALKKLMRSAQDQRGDVRAEFLRSLDADDETGAQRRKLLSKALEGKPEDRKASEWVANVYGASLVGPTEKRRMEYEAKKKAALESGAATGSEGEGDDDSATTETVNPDEILKKTVAKLFKDVESADVDAFEKASDAVKAEERKRLESIKKAVTQMIATLI